jgi:NAD(P)-dependent dehydrogenase (short-subunit alcohol dehydrogenase family)
MKLTGKVALITNVRHYMGPAVTEEFAREGATLALHDREPAASLRAALRVMRPAGRGKIVNIPSAAGVPGLARYAAYSAARAGANGLTKAVGQEVARDGVQVNAIAQNYVENPNYFPPALVADDKALARMVRNIPAGRLARGEESARLAVYLASEDSDFFVGQVVPFAGGWI